MWAWPQNGQITVNLACDLQPDVVLMDLSMPRLNGIEATREIAKKIPGVRVLILADRVEARSLHEALEAGASGYLSKHCSSEELVQAIHNVAEEGTHLSPAAGSVVVHHYVNGEKCISPFTRAPLTAQELQDSSGLPSPMALRRLKQCLCQRGRPYDKGCMFPIASANYASRPTRKLCAQSPNTVAL